MNPTYTDLTTPLLVQGMTAKNFYCVISLLTISALIMSLLELDDG